MERSDWKPQAQPVLVCEEIATLLDIPQQSTFYSFQYTHICRAITDRTRLSGIPFKIYESRTWEEIGPKSREQYLLNSAYALWCSQKPNDEYRTQHGIFIKPGKLAAAIYPDATPDEVSRIADKWAKLLRESANPDTSSLQVSQIPSDIYTLSSDFSSCMNSQDKCRFEIYDDLPGTSILYLTDDNNRLIGRALLHNNVFVGAISDNQTIKIMDRIYSNNAMTESLFIQYARENNYYRKQRQALGVNEYYTTNDVPINLDQLSIRTTDLQNKYTEVPYIDTFCYYHDTRPYPILSSAYNLSGSRALTTLQETNGEDSNAYLVDNDVCCTCSNCEERINTDQDNYIQISATGDCYCEACSEDYCWVECCNDYVHSDDVVFINGEVYCEHHARQYFTLCEDCGEWQGNDEVVEVHNYGMVCEHCRDNNDKFYYCEDCNTWYSDRGTDCTYLDNLEITVCKNCYQDYARCPDCADWQREDEMTYDDEEKAYYCKGCYPSLVSERKIEQITKRPHYEPSQNYLETTDY